MLQKGSSTETLLTKFSGNTDMDHYSNLGPLNNSEQHLLDLTIASAEKSISKKARMVGCLIECTNGKLFEGSTNEHPRMIGSTCAERMAVDQLYRDGDSVPKAVYLTGLLERDRWGEDDIITPCGGCRELLNQMRNIFELPDLDVICFSWNKQRVLKIKLSKLFPEFK